MFPILGMTTDAQLILWGVLAIALVIVLIGWLKMNSTLALMVGAIALGLMTLPYARELNPKEPALTLASIAKSFQDGAGAILGGTAFIIALGAMLGKMLEESGGAEVVSTRITQLFGIQRAAWAIFAIAILIGIPVFFPVGMMLITPLVYTLSRGNKIPVMSLGIPLTAALSSMHALVPPHPGPMAAMSYFSAKQIGETDVGKTILYSLLIGIPCAMVSGMLYSRWLMKRDKFPDADDFVAKQNIVAAGAQAQSRPSFALALITLLLPILLISIGSIAARVLNEGMLRDWITFIGGPLVSMLIAALFSFWSFGIARGFNATQILKFSNDCMIPIASMFLVVGAGGGFNKVLQDGGVGEAIKHYAAQAQLSPLVLGWLAAAVIRIAAGSSTVAITAAAGIVGPLIKGHTDVNMELLVIAMGAGSLILSHLNDGGFWIVKEMFGLSVSQTVKCWTIPTTIGSVLALLLTLALQAVLPR